MGTTRERYQDDALYLIFLRNEFYRKKFHLALFLYILSLFVIGTLVYAIIFLVKNPPHPLYFVTDDMGRLLTDPPKTSPNMSLSDVIKWTTEAIEAAYTYDFVNYRLELQSAQKYFTDFGWRNYMKGLDASGNLLALNKYSYLVTGKVVGPPKILNQGILGGAYAWKFEFPFLVNYSKPPYDGKDFFQNPLILTVIVQRQSLLSSYKGLGIIQMSGRSAVKQPAQAIEDEQ